VTGLLAPSPSWLVERRVLQDPLGSPAHTRQKGPILAADRPDGSVSAAATEQPRLRGRAQCDQHLRQVVHDHGVDAGGHQQLRQRDLRAPHQQLPTAAVET
jgi:hypothetical protein